MTAYIVRRALYAIPILIGVNLLTFFLFFKLNTPDDMARLQLGARRITAEAVELFSGIRSFRIRQGSPLPLPGLCNFGSSFGVDAPDLRRHFHTGCWRRVERERTRAAERRATRKQ